MPDYLVSWAIDVEGAESALKAAQAARKCQLNPSAAVGVFDVKDSATGAVERVDVDEEEVTRPGPPSIVDMSAEDCRQLLTQIAGILWPDGDPDHEHGSDELGEIANALRFLRPAESGEVGQ